MTALPLHGVRRGERAAILAVFLQLGLFAGAWAAALPAVRSGLALSDRAVGLALLSFAAGSIASTLATGAFAARLGARRAIAIGVLATAAALPLPSLARTLPELALATAAMGIAMGLLDVSMNGAAGALEARRGEPLMSSFHGAFSLGGLAGAAMGGALAGLGFGAPGQLGVAAAAAGLVGVAALPFLGADAPRAAAPDRRARPSAGRLAAALPGRRLLGLGLVTAFCFVVEGAVGDWSAIYLDTVAGSGLALASAGYAGFSIAMAGVRFAGDGAVAALGARAVLVGGGALAGAGLLLAVLLPLPFAAAVGFGLVGLGLGNVAPVAFSAAARIGADPAAGVAPVATVGYAGFLLGPPLIGLVSGAAGLRVALACLVLATAVVAVVGYGVGDARRSRT